MVPRCLTWRAAASRRLKEPAPARAGLVRDTGTGRHEGVPYGAVPNAGAMPSPVVGPSAAPDRDGQRLFVIPDRRVDLLGIEAEADEPIQQLA